VSPRKSLVKQQLKQIPKSAMPHRVKPMKATLTAEPFDDPNWLFEIKWDGYRAIAEVEAGAVRLYSRNLLSFEKRYAPIVDDLKKLKHEAVLDGEIVVLGEDGRAKFESLQNYRSNSRSNLAYYIFDLLWLDGHDLRDLPLIRRKDLLQQILKETPVIKRSDHIVQYGRRFFELVKERQVEGIVAKDMRSRYHAGRRSDCWRKIKAKLFTDAVIAGFTKMSGRKGFLGALILGHYRDGSLVYIGHTGTGFSDKTLRQLWDRLEPMRQTSSPFKKRLKTNGQVYWVRPELVCEVSFTEWTNDRNLRHPVYLGLREGKPGFAVKRDRTDSAK
jgi:bifunctional non-homologous end joining protein LigD